MANIILVSHCLYKSYSASVLNIHPVYQNMKVPLQVKDTSTIEDSTVEPRYSKPLSCSHLTIVAKSTG